VKEEEIKEPSQLPPERKESLGEKKGGGVSAYLSYVPGPERSLWRGAIGEKKSERRVSFCAPYAAEKVDQGGKKLVRRELPFSR